MRNIVTGDSHPATAGDAAGDYARGLADAAGQQLSSAKERLGSASSDASQYASNTAGDLKHQAGQFVDHASATAQGKQPGVWDKLKNSVTGHGNDGANAGDAAGQYVNAAGQYAQASLLLLSFCAFVLAILMPCCSVLLSVLLCNKCSIGFCPMQTGECFQHPHLLSLLSQHLSLFCSEDIASCIW